MGLEPTTTNLEGWHSTIELHPRKETIIMSRKRNPKNWCLKCSSRCRNSRSNLCSICHSQQLSVNFGQTYRIADFSQLQSRHRFQPIRNHAKRVMNSSNKEKNLQCLWLQQTC